MALELKHIFARIGMGSGKIENDAFVDLGACGIAKARQDGPPRGWNASGQLAGEWAEIPPGEPNHANAAATGRGGNGHNRISWLSVCHPRSGV